MKIHVRLFVSLFVACIGQVSAQNSLNFNLGGPANLETSQNQFIFANGGVTATATAWSVSRTALANGFEQSQVVQWSPGLGVKNPTEVITDVPYVPYYVDNQDHYDFILFTFSEKVNITSVRVHPSSGTFDLDASYWLGNVGPGLDLAGDTFASLASSGFGPRIDSDGTVSNAPRNVAITTPTGGVNAILFGAKIGGDADYDRFKVSVISGTTVIPEPGSAALLLGTLVLAAARRRR